MKTVEEINKLVEGLLQSIMSADVNLINDYKSSDVVLHDLFVQCKKLAAELKQLASQPPQISTDGWQLFAIDEDGNRYKVWHENGSFFIGNYQQCLSFYELVSGKSAMEGQLVDKVKELLLFTEDNGTVVNGFRVSEIVLELKQFCSGTGKVGAGPGSWKAEYDCRALLQELVSLKVMKENLYKGNPDGKEYAERKFKAWEAAKQFLSGPVMTGQVDGDYVLRTIDTDKWYWCKCESCGWEDSSEFTEGCHPIGETGDHTDPVCPVCGSGKLEGEHVCDVPQYSGIVKVKIPYDVFIKPYLKVVKKLSEIEAKSMYHMDDAPMDRKIMRNVLINISDGGTGIDQCPNSDFSRQKYLYALQTLKIINIGHNTTLTCFGNYIKHILTKQEN